MEDVGRVREAVRPVELPPLEQLAEELEQLPACVLPREVRVALREAALGERRHRRRPRERLREEDHLGVLAPHLADQPLPERQRLRVRVVDAEDGDAAADPLEDDVEERLPQTAPVLTAEVDVVDVLVALRRVLRVFQRPVGAAVEPLWMLLQPRVVGRALDREVERDLDAELLARLRRGARNSCSVPSDGSDRVVPALFGADRPRAADVALLRRLGVVPPLAVRVADRVDRRQVEDVEAELGEARQQLADALEAAPGAREELVPRAEAREYAVDVHRVGRPTTPSRRARPQAPRAPASTVSVLAEEHRALRQLAVEVGLARGDLPPQLVLERGDAIDPGLDPEAPRDPAGRPRTSRPRRRCRAARAASRTSGSRPGRLVANRRAERLVPVAEDPRGHRDPARRRCA